MTERVDIPVKDIQEDYEVVEEFLKEEYSSRETYGKRWVGKKAFKIAAKQINDWKRESKEIQESWSELKNEIDSTI